MDKSRLLLSTLGFLVIITDQCSHFIEVSQGAIFMEQNMRFGLIFGRLAILKKTLGQL
jgi:hypothetical protein